MSYKALVVIFVSWFVSSAQATSINDILRNQSPVKSQGTVGSCSMFSAMGLLEYKLWKLGYTDGRHWDLSEQYLLYLTSGQRGKEGSWTPDNAKAMDEFGFIHESQWGFNPSPWYKKKSYSSLPGIAKRTCGHLRNTEIFMHCLVGQRDPRLLEATDGQLTDSSSGLFDPTFKEFRDYAIYASNEFRITSSRVRSKNAMMRHLRNGEPLIVDLKNFYQAWNRSRASKAGLRRDMDMFYKGIVSYPHKASKDYAFKQSIEYKTGHSFVLLGYDENVRIERVVEAANGGWMDSSSTGVFYFKNSWGTWGFGKDFTLNGEKFPGFGMIAMDYVLDYGKVYRIKINGK